MKAKPRAVKEMVLQLLAAGQSYAQVAGTFHLPRGTVKSWWRRSKAGKKPGMQPGMQPGCTQPSGDPMQPGMQPGMQPAAGPRETGLPLCRGVTREDLPGKSVMERSINFRGLKRGIYPPRCWKIPGWVEGATLVAAMAAANAAKGRKKAGNRTDATDRTD